MTHWINGATIIQNFKAYSAANTLGIISQKNKIKKVIETDTNKNQTAQLNANCHKIVSHKDAAYIDKATLTRLYEDERD